jgi:hyperosmotically inducible protein
MLECVSAGDQKETLMKRAKLNNRNAILVMTLAAAFMSVPQISMAAASDAKSLTSGDNGTSRQVQTRLNKSQFKNVKVDVQNGVATLSGTVNDYYDKADADKRAHKVKGVNAVRNEIEVAGPNVSDAQLRAKLGKELTYDRVGYGNMFNSISLDVQNGVVTLGGHARTDVDAESAMALVSTHPGVKDVKDEIQVDPVSFMDNQTRFAVARAVYGFPSLNRYAIDPAKTIRISVQNGHVELYGVVDTKADSEAAYIQANAVPGVFSVKNYLQVANQPTEGSKAPVQN